MKSSGPSWLPTTRPGSLPSSWPSGFQSPSCPASLLPSWSPVATSVALKSSAMAGPYPPGSEQAGRPSLGGSLEPQVLVGGTGGHPAARGALDEALLEEVRLVHV